MGLNRYLPRWSTRRKANGRAFGPPIHIPNRTQAFGLGWANDWAVGPKLALRLRRRVKCRLREANMTIPSTQVSALGLLASAAHTAGSSARRKVLSI